MAETQPTVPFFKKSRKIRPTTARRRSVSPGVGSDPYAFAGPSVSKSQVVLPSKKQGLNLLSAGTKRTTQQRDDGADEEEREGPDVKWTAAGSHQQAAQEIIAGDEAEEMLAKRQKKVDPNDEEDAPDDGLYRGKNAYKSHLKKSQDVPKAMRVGPQRGSSTIKTVTIIDYQPDVCKDYKETGYCGFGDTCKFLHDRGTYLAGWQLDKLAENPKRQVGDDDSDSDDSDDEDIPFACLICKKEYTDPVVTRCGHYYCSACAIKRFAKTPKCLACGAPTGGIFNRADKVIARLKKKKEAEAADDDAPDVPGDSGVRDVKLEGLGEDSDEDDDSDNDE